MPWLASPGSARLQRTALAVACSLPLLALADPALADGWGPGSRHHGGWDHRGQHRHRHHDGLSGLFVWDLSPPPRTVVVPGPVYVQPPPVVAQGPPGYCREYTSTSIVGGRPVQTFGTACLQPDGSWRIVSAY